MPPTTIALIVAAGRGTRARKNDLSAPKQYVGLNGEPVLKHVIDGFVKSSVVDKVMVVIHCDDVQSYEALIDGIGDKLLTPVFGGETRQQSVFLGLQALAEINPSYVMIHDGVRPCFSGDLLSKVAEALPSSCGVLPALPISDTLKRVDGDCVSETVDRGGLWSAQTPQSFSFSDIFDAHEKASLAVAENSAPSFTDDASIAEWAGLEVKVVLGEVDNIKITTLGDFERGEQILNRKNDVGCPDIRVGQGFDVHKFEPGSEVILCGVTIPFSQKLKGHSDADVGLHALTDAIYGALGEGDIGTHFPPSEPEWKGASSDIFLAHAANMVREKGGALTHVDITLICELPKIGPHAVAMKTAIASILDIDLSRVSVKATTTEGLGFMGRGEGISAMATATVVF